MKIYLLRHCYGEPESTYEPYRYFSSMQLLQSFKDKITADIENLRLQYNNLDPVEFDIRDSEYDSACERFSRDYSLQFLPYGNDFKIEVINVEEGI